MAVQGLVRLRKHQFGRQAAHGTKVAATYAYGLTGVPTNELNWTDPEVDAGSRVITAAPYREAPDLTASLDTPALEYNTLPIIHSAFFGGQVAPTGGGTAKTWAFDPSADTVELPDEYTYEFGDDVLTDWFQNGDGILESFEISGPVGLGPLTASLGWRFGSISSTGSTDSPVTGTVPTPGLSVATDGAKVYLKDMSIFIADTVAGLGAGQVLDALHAFTLRGNIEWDQKRYANGTQTFDISAWGPGLLSIELELVFGKTADTVGVGSESDHWLSDESVNRYIQLTFESTVIAQTPSTPYSWDVILPARYYTREEGEEGQNTTIVLTAHAFYDPDDLDGFFQSTIVNTLTEAELGLAGS